MSKITNHQIMRKLALMTHANFRLSEIATSSELKSIYIDIAYLSKIMRTMITKNSGQVNGTTNKE